MKQTLVFGASENPSRYSFMAVNKLREHGHPVVAVGKKTGKIGDVEIIAEPKVTGPIDTVTLYLNPDHQKQYESFIIHLKPKRVIFNPGTENFEFQDLLKQNGIEAIEACTLVLLSTDQY